MTDQPRRIHHGPFRADQLRDGDRYELSNGHPIYCAPAGWQHGSGSVTGGLVLDSDPDVQWTGADVGISPEAGTLRAPDVVVRATSPSGDGTWLTEAPPLAVEYAGPGQDERDLKIKIAELLAAGTRQVWVVRLVEPQRVEAYRAGEPMKVHTAADMLEAPGILRNPVPVRALFDREAAHDVVLRNLLQRRGYASLNDVRVEGREEGREEGMVDAILTLLRGRRLAVDATVEARLRACHDRETLRRWLLNAAQAERADGIFDR
ncbi:MAG: Uma2 family endonuclease [Candidatus Contendobacter sp.]|nr:Uma2 family endonuclease [Candidatus Contendobacter sp.]MDG4558895.1 Uma2 family endonuclease [Candidatus Contendobacter sp.]